MEYNISTSRELHNTISYSLHKYRVNIEIMGSASRYCFNVIISVMC